MVNRLMLNGLASIKCQAKNIFSNTKMAQVELSTKPLLTIDEVQHI